MENPIWQPNDYIGFLSSEKENVREWALERCQNLQIPINQEVPRLLNDKVEKIVISVLHYVEDNKLKEFALPILKIFRNSSGTIAGHCARALGEIEYIDSIPFMKNKLESGKLDESEFHGIIDALGSMKTDDSLHILEDMYASMSYRIDSGEHIEVRQAKLV